MLARLKERLSTSSQKARDDCCYLATTIPVFRRALTTAVAGSNVTISLTATQTAAVSPGNYVYDVEYTQSGGTIVERLAEGIITISAEATK